MELGTTCENVYDYHIKRAYNAKQGLIPANFVIKSHWEHFNMSSNILSHYICRKSICACSSLLGSNQYSCDTYNITIMHTSSPPFTIPHMFSITLFIAAYPTLMITPLELLLTRKCLHFLKYVSLERRRLHGEIIIVHLNKTFLVDLDQLMK